MVVTVSSLIPATTTQATVRSRPKGDSADESKDFYCYLRSSTQDSSASEHAVKVNKNEKPANRKADTDQATNAITTPMPPLAEQPTPPLSAAALLGLPTVQQTNADETGKVAADGTEILSLSSGELNSLGLQPALYNSDGTLLAKGEPKTDDQPDGKLQSPSVKSKPENAETLRSLQANQDSSAGVTIDPALWSVPSSAQADLPKESGNAASLNPDRAATGSEVNQDIANLPASSTAPDKVESTSMPGHLAFAMRLSEGSINSKVESPAQQTLQDESAGGATTVGNADSAIAVQAAIESQLKEQSHRHDESAGTTYYEAPQTPQGSAHNISQAGSEQEAHATAANLPSTPETTSSEPVRNVHMQVVGDDNNRVDVRLTERGGELHVSVKSGDINLAQNLQDHMPELTSRLEQQRFQAEVWAPKLADNGKAETSGTRDFSSNGNNNSNQGSNPDQQGKRQQQYRPDWVDVLESSTQSTGKTYQTWPQ